MSRHVQMRRLTVTAAILVIAALVPASAQEAPEASPPPVIVPQEIEFAGTLPTTPVAWVGDEAIPASDLLRQVLEENLSLALQRLMLGRMAEMELEAAELTLDEDEIRDEMGSMIKMSAPQLTLDEFLAQNPGIGPQLAEQAATNRAWKKLYWKEHGIPEDQQHDQTANMIVQIFMRGKMGNYDQWVRGSKDPAPEGVKTPAGSRPLAVVKNKITGQVEAIGADEALAMLLGLVREGALSEAVSSIIQEKLVGSQLAAKNLEVTAQEVAEWVAAQEAKYPTPPMTWEMILQLKQTTRDREIQRFRRLRAYQKVHDDYVPTEEELDTFVAENKGYFKGETRVVSHILAKTADPITGTPLPEEEANSAKERITNLRGKALEGADFAWLAENFSDDPSAAQNKGRIGQKLKAWGGGFDPAFLTAVSKMNTVGEISEPVRSRFGWHLIKLEEHNLPPVTDPDWHSPQYKDWIEDEYLTRLMTQWLEDLERKATIRRADSSVLRELKDRTYYRKLSDTEGYKAGYETGYKAGYKAGLEAGANGGSEDGDG